MQAGASQKTVLFDDNRLQAPLRGADGGYIPAGPAADDSEIVFRQAPLLPRGRHNSGFLQDLGSTRGVPALLRHPSSMHREKKRDVQKLDSNSRSRPPQPRPAPGISYSHRILRKPFDKWYPRAHPPAGSKRPYLLACASEEEMEASAPTFAQRTLNRPIWL